MKRKMLSLERSFQKWVKENPPGKYEIIHKPDKDERFIYFYLKIKQDSGEIYPFKLGKRGNELTGEFVSDYSGNCSNGRFCEWSNHMKKYTKSAIKKLYALQNIMNEAIRYATKLSKKDISMRTITSGALTYDDKLRECQIRMIEDGFKITPLIKRKWFATININNVNFKCVLIFGNTEKSCPIIAIISPRVTIGNNVSLGGLIQIKGLTPYTWDSSFNSVSSRIKTTLRYAVLDPYSDDEYREDEINASLKLYFSNKVGYDKKVHVLETPIDISPALIKKNNISPLSKIFLSDYRSHSLGPFFAQSNNTLSLNRIDLPVDLYLEYYEINNGLNFKLTTYNFLDRQAFKVVEMDTDFIRFSYADKSDLSIKYVNRIVDTEASKKTPGVTQYMHTNKNLGVGFGKHYADGIRVAKELKRGEVGLSKAMMQYENVLPGDEIEIELYEVFDEVDVTAKSKLLPKKSEKETKVIKKSDEIPAIFSSDSYKSNIDLVHGLQISGPYLNVINDAVPKDMILVPKSALEDLGIQNNDSVDIKLHSRNTLGEFVVTKSREDEIVMDSIEISERMYENLLSQITGSEFLILSVTTQLGLHGAYAVKVNKSLGTFEVRFTKLQMINLNLVTGDTVFLDIISLPQPKFVKLRPRRIIMTQKLKNPTQVFLENVSEYKTLSAGHTINLKYGDQLYQLDVIELIDKEGHSLNSCYMRKSFQDIDFDVKLEILPALKPKNNALTIPFEEYSHETVESEEETDSEEDFSFKKRSPDAYNRKEWSGPESADYIDLNTPPPQFEAYSEDSEDQNLLPNTGDEDELEDYY